MRHAGSVLPVILVCGLVIAAGLPVASSETSGRSRRGGAGKRRIARPHPHRQEPGPAHSGPDPAPDRRPAGARPPACWPLPTGTTSTSCAGTASASRSSIGTRPGANSSSSGSAVRAPWPPSAPPATPSPWSPRRPSSGRTRGAPWKPCRPVCRARPSRPVLSFPTSGRAPSRLRPRPGRRPRTRSSRRSSRSFRAPTWPPHVQTLQDFQTRYASTTNCEAAGESLFSRVLGPRPRRCPFRAVHVLRLLHLAQRRRREDGRDLPGRHLHHLFAL